MAGMESSCGAGAVAASRAATPHCDAKQSPASAQHDAASSGLESPTKPAAVAEHGGSGVGQSCSTVNKATSGSNGNNNNNENHCENTRTSKNERIQNHEQQRQAQQQQPEQAQEQEQQEKDDANRAYRNPIDATADRRDNATTEPPIPPATQMKPSPQERRQSLTKVRAHGGVTNRSISAVSTSTVNSNSNNDSDDSGNDWLPRMTLLGGLLNLDGATDELESVVGDFLRTGCLVGIIVWIILVAAALLLAPAESFERLEGMELRANHTVLALLLSVNGVHFMRLIVRDNGTAFVRTGVLLGVITVEGIAMVSVSLLAFFPTPVVIDPVTGMRCHLVRWAEWTVLAFLMTFMTESIDLPLQGGDTSTAWLHGIAIGASTIVGGLFPLCQTLRQWLILCTISCALFSSIYIRVYQRMQRLKTMPRGGTVQAKEDYERAEYSLRIISVCCISWTGLVLAFFFCCLAPHFAPPGSFLSSHELILVTESMFELLSKAWYLQLLVEVHSRLFDNATRTVRRLEEVRRLMSAIWETSSDVMALCSSKDDHILTLVSPSFFMVQQDRDSIQTPAKLAHDAESQSNGVAGATTILEIDPKDGSHRTFAINLSEPVSRQTAMKLNRSNADRRSGTIHKDDSTITKNTAVLSELICRIYDGHGRASTHIDHMYRIDSNQEEYKISCEAKVTNLQHSAHLIVLRDISERFQRFETEKKLIGEITARRKDAEANRFTRHEVKNGILAAIGLLDSLKDASAKRDDNSSGGGPSSDDAAGDSDGEPGTGVSEYDECLGELDNTLRDILDTIMDHAMSREVIYEEYKVRREKIKVPQVLTAIRRHTSWNDSRFPLEMEPFPFPVIGMDPRLLRYIYQNAVSNACRYGDSDKNITTSIMYDEGKKEFQMQVINAPGPGHEHLRGIDPDEVNAMVFSPSTRLHTKSEDEEFVTVTGSSGDGAWIMQKCAKTLKGECSIKFEPARTVFSFHCPAKSYIVVERKKAKETQTFTELPANTWGVVIDDSGIQRKLMDRFLKIAGIPKDKRIIVGKDSKEIYGFCDMVVDLLRDQPEGKFLVIADENLEVVEGAAMHGTVSGSLCIQRILERLEPSEESRLLALVRSANDSNSDIETYNARAHGYLHKAPIDKHGVIGAIRPWWLKRFPMHSDQPAAANLLRQDSVNSLDSDFTYDPFHDIHSILDVIDALCNVHDVISLRKRWRTIQDRLQRLKGDLKTVIPEAKTETSDALEEVLQAIDDLRFGDFPEDLQERWGAVRRSAIKIMDAEHRKQQNLVSGS